VLLRLRMLVKRKFLKDHQTAARVLKFQNVNLKKTSCEKIQTLSRLHLRTFDE